RLGRPQSNYSAYRAATVRERFVENARPTKSLGQRSELMQAFPAETAIAEPMTGVRKAAIFLISLGEKASSDIIPQLPEKELRLVSTEITRLDRSISAEQSEQVLEEFHRLKTAGDSTTRGGAECAQKLLTSALGAAPASQLMERITQSPQSRSDRYASA